MTRPVRDWNVDQSMLPPLSVHDFVPADHVAHFIRDTVAEELDLSAVWAAYGGDRGQPRYHPAMMTALLLYAYCQGIYSSRRIAAACEQRVDFMAVTGMERPDFGTTSDRWHEGRGQRLETQGDVLLDPRVGREGALHPARKTDAGRVRRELQWKVQR